jgi:hypothetical protein
MAMTHKRTQAIAMVIAGALAAAGCGESQTFVRDYNEATKPLLTLTANAARTDVSASVRQLDGMAGQLNAIDTRLRGLEPPADARDELTRLRKAIAASARRFRRMASAVRERDQRGLVREAQRWAREGAEMVRAEQALKAAVQG